MSLILSVDSRGTAWQFSSTINWTYQTSSINESEVTPEEKKRNTALRRRERPALQKNRDTGIKTFLNFLRSIFVACLDISPRTRRDLRFLSFPCHIRSHRRYTYNLVSKVLRENRQDGWGRREAGKVLSAVISTHKSINLCNYLAPVCTNSRFPSRRPGRASEAVGSSRGLVPVREATCARARARNRVRGKWIARKRSTSEMGLPTTRFLAILLLLLAVARSNLAQRHRTQYRSRNRGNYVISFRILYINPHVTVWERAYSIMGVSRPTTFSFKVIQSISKNSWTHFQVSRTSVCVLLCVCGKGNKMWCNLITLKSRETSAWIEIDRTRNTHN